MIDLSKVKISDAPLSKAEQDAPLAFGGKRKLNPDGEYQVKVAFGKTKDGETGVFADDKGNVKVYLVNTIVSATGVDNLNGFTLEELVGRRFHDFIRVENEIDRRRLRQLAVILGFKAEQLNSPKAIVDAIVFALPNISGGQDALLFSQWRTYDKNNKTQNPGKNATAAQKAAYYAKDVKGMKNFPKDARTGFYLPTFEFPAIEGVTTGSSGEASENIGSYGVVPAPVEAPAELVTA